MKHKSKVTSRGFPFWLIILKELSSIESSSSLLFSEDASWRVKLVH